MRRVKINVFPSDGSGPERFLFKPCSLGAEYTEAGVSDVLAMMLGQLQSNFGADFKVIKIGPDEYNFVPPNTANA